MENKRGRKPKAEKKTSNLLSAIKFVSPAQIRDGLPYQNHFLISNGMIIGFDGAITIGHPIEEELGTCCPNSEKLLAAIAKCGDGYTITQNEYGNLKIKSGKFSAVVECMAIADMPASLPDPVAARIGEDLRTALAAVMGLATEGDSDPKKAGVMLAEGVCCATNGAALLEAWHGYSLPPGMLVPKSSVVAITKSESPMEGFGYSGKSLTIWYENKAFLKTQLFNNNFPNYGKLFENIGVMETLPESFFDGIETVKAFTAKDENFVYFKQGLVSSSLNPEKGATYEIEFSPEGFAVNPDYIKLVKHAMIKAWFDVPAGKCAFLGSKVRGIILGKR